MTVAKRAWLTRKQHRSFNKSPPHLKRKVVAMDPFFLKLFVGAVLEYVFLKEASNWLNKK